MPDDEPPQDADVDDVSSSLNESLKTCRSMVADYRAFLSNDDVDQRFEKEVDQPPPTGFESHLDNI